MKKAVAVFYFLFGFVSVSAQTSSLNGRWLFHGVSGSGSRAPLLILEVSRDGREAKLLSTTAPTGAQLESFKADGNAIHLVLGLGMRALTFEGRLQGDTIEGKLEGARLAFIAERTQRDTIELRPATGERQALSQALRIRAPKERIAALSEFLQKHPESGLRGSVREMIFSATMEGASSKSEMLQAGEEFIESSPDKPNAKRKVASRLATIHHLLDQAEQYAREALEDFAGPERNRAAYLDTLGGILFDRGKLNKAATHLEQAHQLDPDRGEYALHLAQVLEAQGQNTQARELYLATYIRGGDPTARVRLESTYKREHGSLEGLHELIDRGYAERPPWFEPGTYKGTVKQNVLLAELFTGSECGPCQASDTAFDGLLEHYPDTVVTVVQYHLDVPAPDPLTNSDAMDRGRYYQVQGTPTAVFGGTERHTGGGHFGLADKLFLAYQQMITPLLDRSHAVELQAEAELEQDTVRVQVRVKAKEGLPLDALRLRIVLLEGTAHYTGRNGIHLHREVARKLLGGAEGFPLATSESKVSTPEGAAFDVEADLVALEAELRRFLTEFKQKEKPKSLGLTHRLERDDLSVVVFVQDDDTREVLHALRLELR